jgi:hypothetical protein
MSAPAKPLTAEGHARAAEMRAAVHATIPDAVPLIHALHRAGLIDGWRSVTYVGPPREMPNAFGGPFLRGDELTKAFESKETP